MSRARHLIACTARRLHTRESASAGYTLVEMLVVLLILGIVLGALISAWVTGFHAELDATRRYEAQRQARLAVDRMRDELHCADLLTLSGPSSFTAQLPADCPEAQGVVTNLVYDTQLVSTGRYRLRRNSVAIADHLTSGNVFAYVAPSATSLGKLSVTLPVDVTPGDSIASWDLAADIVLRNTTRA
jgi:prepilin-type N-terminal cleavage/methylation domain-containing protein